jgi:hypothetical protein
MVAIAGGALGRRIVVGLREAWWSRRESTDAPEGSSATSSMLSSHGALASISAICCSSRGAARTAARCVLDTTASRHEAEDGMGGKILRAVRRDRSTVLVPNV